jgi:hypothetical protein
VLRQKYYEILDPERLFDVICTYEDIYNIELNAEQLQIVQMFNGMGAQRKTAGFLKINYDRRCEIERDENKENIGPPPMEDNDYGPLDREPLTTINFFN